MIYPRMRRRSGSVARMASLLCSSSRSSIMRTTPGDYSMICFGAVLVREELQQSFYGRLRPISEQWIPEALAISGFSRAETLTFDDPKTVMEAFARWIADHVKGRALFVSDNNGFDFA